ncbi:MAG: hypothetical protein ACYST2_03140, partial [Planctomycetota bacterium]
MQSIPYVEPQRSTQVSDVSADSGDSDLLVNNLIYEQPKALSLAVNRTYQKQYFQRNNYNGDKSTTMICDWNTGTSYVDACNSYLSFKIKLTTDGAAGSTGANFGSGSAMNCINEVRIRSRSGTELDRTQMANLWSKYDSTFSKPDTNLTTVGSVQGFGPTRRALTDPAILGDATSLRVNLPLYVLSPFFRPIKKQLIPPQLASGLHMEIVLEDFRTAITQKAGVITGYEIEELYFNLDCVELTDDTQRTLNMESADNGLEYAYERIFTAISQQPSQQLSISQQVRKAVSQANYVTTITLDPTVKVGVAEDSLVSIPFNYTSFQYRLGSLYFPHQRVND